MCESTEWKQKEQVVVIWRADWMPAFMPWGRERSDYEWNGGKSNEACEPAYLPMERQQGSSHMLNVACQSPVNANGSRLSPSPCKVCLLVRWQLQCNPTAWFSLSFPPQSLSLSTELQAIKETPIFALKGIRKMIAINGLINFSDGKRKNGTFLA